MYSIHSFMWFIVLKLRYAALTSGKLVRTLICLMACLSRLHCHSKTLVKSFLMQGAVTGPTSPEVADFSSYLAQDKSYPLWEYMGSRFSLLFIDLGHSLYLLQGLAVFLAMCYGHV